MRLLLLLITLTALPLLPGCGRAACSPRAVTPPPCLAVLAPTPPAEDASDDAWVSYHVDLEVWAAEVERACGAHLVRR